MSLAASVRRSIRRHEMLPDGGRVVVALSGGPDSVALLFVLCDLATSGDIVLGGVAHFNHQLRGAAADDDEQFCRDLAATLGLPIEVGRADVRRLARAQKRSIEDTARRLRYAFFQQAAERLEAEAVAVGHSQDDQAETFLLRLIRGSGTRGLGSIRPKVGLIIRPLLDISREALRQFAVDRALAFREDETNADLGVPRNRVRHELLPYLAREFSPNIAEVLAREAALARQDNDRLDAEAIDLAAPVVLTDTPTMVIDAAALAAAHPAVASRVARLVLERSAGDRFTGFDAVERLLELARRADPGRAVSLPGQHARLRVLARPGEPDRPVIELGPEPPRAIAASDKNGSGGNNYRFELSIPGEVVLPGEMVISAEWAERAPLVEPADSSRVLLSGLTGPLGIRFRRAGDRFHPPGMGGRARKLQDYLVDRKVARAQRDLLPLVVDRDDQIVWIVGHAVAEGRRAAAPSPGVILLIARHLGGEV